jgi:hypothetical protein
MHGHLNVKFCRYVRWSAPFFIQSDANCNMIVCESIPHPSSLYKLPEQTLIS